MRFFRSRKEKDRPAGVLDTGWQFYSSPTTMEPPGTVFRIDPDGKRFIVDHLDVKAESGREAGARVRQSIDVSLGILARFLSLDLLGARAGAMVVNGLEFEIVEPIMEVTTDVEVHQKLKPFLDTLPYRADNRYFVVRASRSALAMTYRLTQEQVAELGGQGAVTAAVTAGGMASVVRGALFEVAQDFPERMRVMFLPDEIKPVAAGLAGGGPDLGLVKVTEVLTWEDG